MAYKLKTTGLAANVRFLICVDPDDGVVKHYSPANVDGYAVTTGANVTIGTQAWDGNTRSYWYNGPGTADADFIKFDTNLPNWTFSTAAQTRTAFCIGETAPASTNTTAFGKDSGIYLSSFNAGGGDTFPNISGLGINSAQNGAQVRPYSAKRIFGMSAVHGTSMTIYWAVDTDSAMSSAAKTPSWSTSSGLNFDLTYAGRRNDSTSSAGRAKFHAIGALDISASESDWDSLRDDWLTVLLEQDAATPTITADQGSYTLTGQSAELLFNRKLTAEYGTHTLTGQDTNLLLNRLVSAAQGSYALTGQDATLTYTQPGVYSLTADSGTYNWTVSDAFADYTMVAVYDTYALTGQDATLTFGAAPPENYSLVADAGSYSLVGRSARLTWSNEVVTTNGNYTISMSMKIGI